MNSKKWIKILLILCAFGIGVVGLFNYKVDSFGIIQTDNYLDKAAKDLADGKIIAGLQNFDERIFRKKIIENINYRKY